jgi:hypothetical protein
MNAQPNQKIIGAFVVGFALVALAYVATNFGTPTGQFDPPVALEAQTAALRGAIPVTDNDNNGIEDWRDDLITSEEISIDVSSTTPYTTPQTLTGKVGVDFLERYLEAQTQGSFGADDATIINDVISDLERSTSFPIYDVPDITIIEAYTEADIVTYANAAGTAIIQSNSRDRENELLILQDIINRKDYSRFEEIEVIALEYRLLHETLRNTPVPAALAKEHLDILNTVMAVEKDVASFVLSYDDPAFTLLRLKRYREDIQGLSIALQNMYTGLLPYSGLFTSADPASVFSAYQPVRIGI